MSVESASYINQLNESNPTSSDLKSEGDNHIRLLKSTLKTTFPNVTGAVTPTHTQLNFVTGVTSAIQDQLNRTLRQSGGSTVNALPDAATRASKVLSFDSSGHPATTIATVDLANAVTAASNAATSETNAAASATAAAGSASTASTQASNASTSATNAASSASAASTSATNAATSASTATTQASNASTSATNAASSASAAATSATNAANSATTAGTHATNAGNSATAAATSASDAAASFDSFDDRYLGSKASNPTLDNDGNALLTGALYWNSTSSEMRVWSGLAWVAAYLPASGYATLTGTETLTNKTINIANNTLTGVQASLVSGTNIKTINGSSVLGSGDLTVAGGSLIFLSTVTASNSATVSIETTFNSTYDAYVIVCTGVTPGTDGVDLTCRFKVGGAYDTSANYKHRCERRTTSSTAYSANVDAGLAYGIIVDNGSMTTTSSSAADFVCEIFNPASTTKIKQMRFRGSVYTSAGVGQLFEGTVLNTSTSALTGIRFAMSSGNVASGTFRLYGIKNS